MHEMPKPVHNSRCGWPQTLADDSSAYTQKCVIEYITGLRWPNGRAASAGGDAVRAKRRSYFD